MSPVIGCLETPKPHTTLKVQRMTPHVKLWTCSTRNTSCTVLMGQLSVNYNFCVSITAYSRYGNITTPPRCQMGIDEIKLHPVTLHNITHVHGQPRCLTLNWQKRSVVFLVSNSQIQEGKLESQIEFKAHGQPDVTVANVTVTSFSFMACPFQPYTEYTVRLRHRYRSETSLWSQWSNEGQGRTGEDAPSSSPMFWRQVIHQDRYRLTSLLWKPLPLAFANGRVRFYNVTCSDENRQVLPDRGNCSKLDISHSSCVLKLPLGRCSCSISASTSAGASQKSWIWFKPANVNEPPPPSRLNVTVVDDRSLSINWAPPAAAVSLSGFVVEWFVVTEKNSAPYHWKRVNSSNTAINITEGVEPFKRYAVSVRALYSNEGPGQSKNLHIYTRQGVPSAGPNLQVQSSGLNVKLSWTIPVEQLHGFIRNYTLHYKTSDVPAKKVVVPGDVEQYSISLSPGHYEFCMQASTEAGEGVNGSTTTVYINLEEISIIRYVILPIGLISLVLMFMVCLAEKAVAKRKLSKDIPDPSHSSLANWRPKTMTGMVSASPDTKYSKVVLLIEREMENYELDQDLSMFATPSSYNPFKWETKYSQNTTNMAAINFTSCPAIHSIVLSSKAKLSSELHHNSSINVKNLKGPLGGDSELCKTSTKSFHYFKQQRKSARPYNLAMGNFTSTPMLNLDSSSQNNISSSCLTFPDLLLKDLMNLSQSSIQVDPYMPV
ncbi:hypothetical protein NL108_010278 [Boleophthalmus pectinirostris]|uniref:interleukin-6 receptor subunit beta n=1 Tax=Boleophthalmus pectinirostris TaxID=150288 RepID=UPI00242FB2AA|nr:interleukin-6 receptor subunit beta [Boleophthalmus pectinirostris]XP_055014421.1 interleukin-6 receptor subunit beta [Boleophthalmus pectinirostris]KAJ0062981.1 hypothetical protein NL108_010278 [Boleophthalmus pectinirostris]